MDKSKAAAEIFNKYAPEYQNKFMDVSLYADSFNFFCRSLKQNASVLELACGPGNVTKYLLDKRNDLKILGTDLAPNMIELAKQNNPGAEFQLMDCREILTLNKKFDALLFGFCFPYLNKEEVERVISGSAVALNESGIVYISTMEDDYEKSGWKKGSKGDEIYMHFYTENFLKETLEKNGFRILFTDRKESFSGNEPVTDLIIIAERI